MSLCNLCQVDSPDALPPVYGNIAQAENNAQERQVVQNALEESLRNSNKSFQVICTPDLMKRISTLAFTA